MCVCVYISLCGQNSSNKSTIQLIFMNFVLKMTNKTNLILVGNCAINSSNDVISLFTSTCTCSNIW